MDDIIIRNNAEEYYEGLDNITIEVENEPNSIVEAYVSGARSRDAEIQHLEEELKTLSVLLEKNGVIKFANLHNQMEIDLLRLRNPWISVSDRLPDEDDTNKEGYTVEVIGMADIADFEQCAWHRRIFNCRLDKRDNVWVYGDRDVICDKPDYWMPVPNISEKKI